MNRFSTVLFEDDNPVINIDITVDTDYDEGQPITVDIKVVLFTKTGNEKVPTDYICLRYFLKDKSYLIINDPGKLALSMYDQIVEKLDETYGSMWGGKNN